VKLTLFSVEEANRMAAEIRPALERLVHAKRDLDRLQRRVDVLSLAASGATAGNPDAQELQQLERRRTVLAAQLEQGVQTIQGRGPVLKDLERGLVDFYSIAGDRLIFLCWQLGEPEVAHWHTLQDGFSGRQPLHRTERDQGSDPLSGG
jgi:hypothetical protein